MKIVQISEVCAHRYLHSLRHPQFRIFLDGFLALLSWYVVFQQHWGVSCVLQKKAPKSNKISQNNKMVYIFLRCFFLKLDTVINNRHPVSVVLILLYCYYIDTLTREKSIGIVRYQDTMRWSPKATLSVFKMMTTKNSYCSP